MSKAVEWYLNAAKQGHVNAQYNLGLCYAVGEGVDEDEEEAVKWLRKAADQGHVDAKKKLKELENDTNKGRLTIVPVIHTSIINTSINIQNNSLNMH